MTPKTIFYTTLILLSCTLDILFSLSRYPILTILVCGIVVVYELIAPYLYSSR